MSGVTKEQKKSFFHTTAKTFAIKNVSFFTRVFHLPIIINQNLILYTIFYDDDEDAAAARTKIRPATHTFTKVFEPWNKCKSYHGFWFFFFLSFLLTNNFEMKI